MATLSTLLSIKYIGVGPPSIGNDKELRKSASNVITKNIENSVKLLVGNNEIISDIPKAVNLLLHRNYPTKFDENGKRIDNKELIQICVPDIFLSESSNFVGPPPNMTARVNYKLLPEK